jgi:hypothetical protein
MDGCAPRQRLGHWTDFIHVDIEGFIQLGWCLVNVNTLPPKLGSLQKGLKTKRLCDFDYIAAIY